MLTHFVPDNVNPISPTRSGVKSFVPVSWSIDGYRVLFDTGGGVVDCGSYADREFADVIAQAAKVVFCGHEALGDAVVVLSDQQMQCAKALRWQCLGLGSFDRVGPVLSRGFKRMLLD